MTQQAQATPEEKPTKELLLRRFKMMDDIVEDVRQQNIKAGLDTKYMNLYVDWTDFDQRKVNYNGWIKAVPTPKSQSNLLMLITSGF